MVVPVLVAPKVGVVPETALLFASLRVMVTVEVADPSATTGPVPVIVEFAIEGAPGVKTTVVPAFTTGVAMVRILLSAMVDARVQVDTPDELEALQAP